MSCSLERGRLFIGGGRLLISDSSSGGGFFGGGHLLETGRLLESIRYMFNISDYSLHLFLKTPWKTTWTGDSLFPFPTFLLHTDVQICK